MRVVDLIHLTYNLNPNFNIQINNNQIMLNLLSIENGIGDDDNKIFLNFGKKGKQIHLFEFLIYLKNVTEDQQKLVFIKVDKSIRPLFSVRIDQKSLLLK